MIKRQVTADELKELIYKYLFALESDCIQKKNITEQFLSRYDISKLNKFDFIRLYDEAIKFEAYEKISADIRKILDSVGD